MVNDNEVRQRKRGPLGLSRKRQLLLGGGASSFNLCRPLLNLSEEEYNSRLQKIREMGGIC